MKFLIKYYNAFLWRFNLYFLRPIMSFVYNFQVKMQKQHSLDIYYKILSKTPVSKLNVYLKENSSLPLKLLVKRIQEIGYIQDIAPVKKNFRISVIIAHYNHQHYLIETLDSILNQSEKPFEIIIVDDLSENQELLENIIGQYIDKINIKLLIPKEKLYTGPARQWGSEMATGDVILINDADDPMHPQRIEITRYFFTKYPEHLLFGVGGLEFTDKFTNNFKYYSEEDYSSSLLNNEYLVNHYKDVFEFQLFSKRMKFGIKRGGAFIASSSSIAYNKDLIKVLKWQSAKFLVNNSFTDPEDYEFTTLAFLLSQKVMAFNLPMHNWRRDSTTNKVYY